MPAAIPTAVDTATSKSAHLPANTPPVAFNPMSGSPKDCAAPADSKYTCIPSGHGDAETLAENANNGPSPTHESVTGRSKGMAFKIRTCQPGARTPPRCNGASTLRVISSYVSRLRWALNFLSAASRAVFLMRVSFGMLYVMGGGPDCNISPAALIRHTQSAF